jgi:sporulation protein YlmC with PRC-barrel domain
MRGTLLLDVAVGLLDHQLVDCDGRRCGNVDDLELDLAKREPTVDAILVGPPVWRNRGLLGRLASMIVPGRAVRVPWSEVEKIDSAVHLRKRAAEYGLGRGDDRARRLVDWIPGS